MAQEGIRSNPADRLYGCLLWLYPAAFRDEYASEMRATLRRRWKDECHTRGAAGLALLCFSLFWDTLRTACEEHSNMLIQDLRFTFRTLARSPLFAAAAILTIALGIGADTAIFSIVDHVLLRPLPFPGSDRLLSVRLTHPTEHDVPMSVADFLDWRSQNRTFQNMAAYSDDFATLTGAGEPSMIRVAYVTDGFFTTLEVHAILGRTFVSGDDKPGRPRTVVLSSELWRTRFHEDPDVIGKAILLDSLPHTVVGVMDAGFAFPARHDLLWAIQKIESPVCRCPYFLTGIARMREGAAEKEATAGLNASIFPTLVGTGQSDRKPIQFYTRPLHESVAATFRPSLVVLMGAVTLVLAVACVNVTNLLLARSAAREREILLRVSLGANTRQLFRHVLTESLVIAALGAGVGLAIAFVALRWFNSAAPALVPQIAPVDLDGRVLLFTAASVLGSGLLVGFAPALRAARLQMSGALRSGRGITGGAGGRGRMRPVVILTEVALAYVLVMGAGLLIRSYVRLTSVNPGARVDHLMTFRMSLPEQRYSSGPAVKEFNARLMDRIRQIPGVEVAGAGSGMPPDLVMFSDEYTFQERPLTPHEPVPVAPVVISTPDYFRALGTPILRGRSFTEGDTSHTPLVAIVNQTMAQKYFPGENPVGKRMRQGGPDRKNPWMEIVGVAGDAKFTGLEAANQPVYYKPFAQAWMRDMAYAVRTRAAAGSVVPALRSAVASLDKDLALDHVQSMEQNLADSVNRPRLLTALMAILAGLGLAMAGIGVYGVVAYSVTCRKQELGVRTALGAMRSGLVWLVIRQGMKPVVGGLLLGIPGALGLAQAARSLLFGIAPQDPLTLAAGLGLLGGAGLLACLLPALRATRVDPATALRSE